MVENGKIRGNMTDLTAQEAAWQTRDHLDDPVIGELRNRFGPDAFTVQATRTGVPVVWVKRAGGLNSKGIRPKTVAQFANDRVIEMIPSLPGGFLRG